VVNTRAKGNCIERKAEDKLEEQGFECSRMPHTRYGDSDHFNLYDLIAVKPGEKIRLIQVKSNQKPNLTVLREKSEELAPFQHATVESWTWFDYEGWVIDVLTPAQDGWETVLDERS